jgi:hypothetical protein
MLFRSLRKNIVSTPHFARRFFHNVSIRKSDLAQYQFTNAAFWASRGMAKPTSNLEQTIYGRKIRKQEIQGVITFFIFCLYWDYIHHSTVVSGEDTPRKKNMVHFVLQ